MRYRTLLRLTFVSFFLLSACATISPFNQVAYEQATSLKVDVLDLMPLAVEPFPTHQDDARKIILRAKKAYEYAKGRPNNEDSTQQWLIMIDPDRNLLGGFIKIWKEKNTLSPSFIQGNVKNITDGFDEIIRLESGKSKPATGKPQ